VFSVMYCNLFCCWRGEVEFEVASVSRVDLCKKCQLYRAVANTTHSVIQVVSLFRGGLTRFPAGRTTGPLVMDVSIRRRPGAVSAGYTALEEATSLDILMDGGYACLDDVQC
jgi:hypothetical protein